MVVTQVTNLFQEASWLVLGATTGTEVDFATQSFQVHNVVSIAPLLTFGFNKLLQGNV